MVDPYPHLRQDRDLRQPLTAVSGVGTRRAELFARKGVHTILDLLLFLPIRYEDRRRVSAAVEVETGAAALVKGRVRSAREQKFRGGRKMFRILIEDDTGLLELLWFNYRKPHLSRFAEHGLYLKAFGKVRRKQGLKQMVHPDVEIVKEEGAPGGSGFTAVYPDIPSISNAMIRRVIQEALDRYLEKVTEPFPEDILRSLGLPGLSEAIRCLHHPPADCPREPLSRCRTSYHRRLMFDRFFAVMITVTFLKQSRKNQKGFLFRCPADVMKQAAGCFPFPLTKDQRTAIREIFDDMASGSPMNRLLQGDVGCGKTAVAAAAAWGAVQNACQVAVMAPTVVLARQHYETFSGLPERMGFRPALLTGALSARSGAEVREKVRTGSANVIIGTQALIQEDVTFDRLGLVVIDEQHRFGVNQRAVLDQKGLNPHLLVMTATPIPRTLAMTLYADMDVSEIREHPGGRRAVATRLMGPSEKQAVYHLVRERLAAGEQVMVICPVIEGNEESDLKSAREMHARLHQLFEPGFRVGLVHGRLPPEEKERVTEGFRRGRVDLLVGTTVVEVGVHAPGATVVVVEHPERLGLTQLHQLRGRVGRGSRQGVCLLMVSPEAPETSRSRLEILAETSDGFAVAQRDLEMRGQGELMGVRQAGVGELDFREVFREPQLLTAAKKAAEKVLKSDPELSEPRHRMLRLMTAEGAGSLDF